MQALISPNENNRICQVEEQDFPVAEPLYWVDCPNDITTDWTYVDGQYIAPIAQEYVVPLVSTKEEIMAELVALTAKIQALGVV